MARRKLEGRTSNAAAVGATVIVTAGGLKQARAVVSQSSYYSHDDLRLHFGLGRAAKADRVEVRWPAAPRRNSPTFTPDASSAITERHHRGKLIGHLTWDLTDPYLNSVRRRLTISSVACHRNLCDAA